MDARGYSLGFTWSQLVSGVVTVSIARGFRFSWLLVVIVLVTPGFRGGCLGCIAVSDVP